MYGPSVYHSLMYRRNHSVRTNPLSEHYNNNLLGFHRKEGDNGYDCHIMEAVPYTTLKEKANNPPPNDNIPKPDESLDLYLIDPYHLATIDGLLNREHALTTFDTRLSLLKAYGSRCTFKDCTCEFDARMYIHLTNPELVALQDVEKRPLTFFLHPENPVPCRLCGRCLRCKAESCTCIRGRCLNCESTSCSCGNPIQDPRITNAYITPDQWRLVRILFRLIWRVLTLNGGVTYVYTFFTERLEFAVLGLGITLMYNLDENLSLFSIRDSTQFWVKIGAWMQNFSILVLIVFILKMIKTVEWMNSTVYLLTYIPLIQRMKRQRFADIETQLAAKYKHSVSYTWEYFSDDEDEGKDDPDIAYINLTQPADANCWRRWRRRMFLV
jgi:hypothetical protein